MSNMSPRVCRQCGAAFIGGPRAWYCPECRVERAKEANKRHKTNKKSGSVIPIGSVLICPDCGEEFIKMSGQHIRCLKCSSKHLKQVDNAQSIKWNKNHPEEIKRSKRNLSKKRHSENTIVVSGTPGITWDKGCQRWKIRKYDNELKRQLYIGKAKDLKVAEEMLGQNTSPIKRPRYDYQKCVGKDFSVLPECWRKVLELKISGMSISDISGILGISPRTVGSYLGLAYSALFPSTPLGSSYESIVTAAINSLCGMQKEIMKLYISGKKYGEIADVLSVSVSCVASTIYFVKKKTGIDFDLAIKNNLNINDIDFADEIKTIRLSFGLTQKQAASFLGVPASTLGRWEAKISKPHPEKQSEMLSKLKKYVPKEVAMESNITELIKGALQSDDYRIRVNFLVGGLMCEESNDTPEKFEKSKSFLQEILNYVSSVPQSGEKGLYLEHLSDTIHEYLDNAVFPE